jgi:hypothetical protein
MGRTQACTCFTHGRALRFQLILPHAAGNPKPPATALPGHFSIVSQYWSSPDGSLNTGQKPGILKLIAEIDEFKGRWTVADSLIQFQASAGM